MRLTLTVTAAMLALTACSPAPPDAASATPAAATKPAGNDGTETYQDAHGSGACTQDCSGHNAGYAWAREHGITDPGDCSGNSESFIEGCQAYANDHGG
jgi:hypothetical protein